MTLWKKLRSYFWNSFGIITRGLFLTSFQRITGKKVTIVRFGFKPNRRGAERMGVIYHWQFGIGGQFAKWFLSLQFPCFSWPKILKFIPKRHVWRYVQFVWIKMEERCWVDHKWDVTLISTHWSWVYIRSTISGESGAVANEMIFSK